MLKFIFNLLNFNKELIKNPKNIEVASNIKEPPSIKPTMDIKMNFKDSLAFVLKSEGGYSDHPSDPGGATNKGIIQKEYDIYRTEKGLPKDTVKNITDQEVEDIYYNKYWVKANCDKMSSKLALAHFDTAVNTGITQATRFLQRSLKIKDDGVFGSGTLSSLQGADQDSIIPEYLSQRRRFYQIISEKNTKLQVFLKGWLNRVNDLEKVVA